MNRANGEGGVSRGNGALRTLLIDARGVLVSTLRQRFKNEICNVEEGKRPKWLAPPIYPAQALDVAALLIDTALAVLESQEHPHDAVMTGCAALNLKSLGALWPESGYFEFVDTDSIEPQVGTRQVVFRPWHSR